MCVAPYPVVDRIKASRKTTIHEQVREMHQHTIVVARAIQREVADLLVERRYLET